jgi:hypothetical protein
MTKRYDRTPVLGLGFSYGTSYAIPIIRNNIAVGNIRYEEDVLSEGERFDILAGKYYGDSSLWWIISAASDVGNPLQAPPGTRIKIPILSDVKKFLG